MHMKSAVQRVAFRYLRSVDESFEDEGWVGEYWGRAGAGILFTTGAKILLLKRSPYVDQPGDWGIPGGALPVDSSGKPMNPLKGALKEVKEEVGTVPGHRIEDRFVYRDGQFRFTTFIAKVTEEFTPRLNWENSDSEWVTEDELRGKKLHFGVKALLKSKNPFS